MSGRLARFLAFSADVTAHTVFDLQGTGLAAVYLSTVDDVVGRDVVDSLLDRHEEAVGVATEGVHLTDLLRRGLMTDPLLGPVARSIVKMWYTGIWYELPATWADAYQTVNEDMTHTVSAAAYTEGLVWPSIGANPPGAKAPGYGAWAYPPQIPNIPRAVGTAGAEGD